VIFLSFILTLFFLCQNLILFFSITDFFIDESSNIKFIKSDTEIKVNYFAKRNYINEEEGFLDELDLHLHCEFIHRKNLYFFCCLVPCHHCTTLFTTQEMINLRLIAFHHDYD
jgi:hypothetical protein